MKTLRIVAMTAIALGLLASPALAKIPVERVEITGPGLTDRVSLIHEDAWQFLMGDWSAHLRTTTPEGVLGPEYSVEVIAMDRPNDVMAFYPFAESGAWLRVPADSAVSWMLQENGSAGRAGWVRVHEGQLAVARRNGLPEAAAPVAEPPAAPTKALPAMPVIEAVPVAVTAPRTGARLGLGLAALGSLLVAGAVIERRALKRRRGA
jgi:hypothetical protein